MSLQKSLMSLEQVLSATGGTLVGSFEPDEFSFSSVATDSRNVKEGGLFVPLVGEFQDGHRFIPAALSAGASGVFVQKKVYEGRREYFEAMRSGRENFPFILVEGNMRALQRLAESYAARFGLLRIGITGSSGKTTARMLVSAVLSQKFRVVSTEGNLNSETGLPLSMFSIRAEHEAGVFEMGMNRKGEMRELAEVYKPKIALVTNIGTAHVGMLGSRENIAAEKKRIFDFFDEESLSVLPRDDDFRSFLEEDVPGKKIYFGADTERVKFLRDEGLDGSLFSVDGIEVRLKLPGAHNYMDAQAAALLALELGLSAQQVKAGVESVEPAFGRSNIRRGKFTVVEDCYNANPDSMKRSLEFCASLRGFKRKVFVLGDMLELGAEAPAAHEEICRLAISCASCVIFVGKEFAACKEKLAGVKSALFVGASDDAAIGKAAECARSVLREGDLVLLKGSRSVGLERLLPLLEAE